MRLPFSSLERVSSAICRSTASSRPISTPTLGLGRRRIVDEARGVGRLALGENLLLDLADLLFEPFDALFGGGGAALRAGRRNCDDR